MHMTVPFVLTMGLLSRNPLEAYIFGKSEPEKSFPVNKCIHLVWILKVSKS